VVASGGGCNCATTAEPRHDGSREALAAAAVALVMGWRRRRVRR
jgi:MYXO-CTERM domain-containing protein